MLKEDLLSWKVCYRVLFSLFLTLTHIPLDQEYIPFYRKQSSPSFNKKGKLQLSALHLPKIFCLEYMKYKSPPKECR